MSLNWLAAYGLSALQNRGQLSDSDVVKMDEALLAEAINAVIEKGDANTMRKALQSIEDALSRPRASYRLKVIARRRGGKEDLRGGRKNLELELAIAKSVYRRQATDKGRMKRAVAEAAIEFKLSKPSVYRALRKVSDRLVMVVETTTENDTREMLGQFYGFVVHNDFEWPSPETSHSFEHWLYDYAGASPADEG